MKATNQNNDAVKFNRLLKKIKRNHRGALEEFYTMYGMLIYSAALTICKCPAVADEVVDDFLIKLWNNKNIEKVRNPKAWIYRVSLNIAKNRLREQRVELEIFEGIAKSENDYDRLLDMDGFEYMIRNLREEEKELLTLRIVYELSFNEISKIFGKPLSTITSRYYGCLKKIKKN